MIASENPSGREERPVSAILGGTGAQGRELAAILHERGHRLVLLGRDEARLREAAEPLGATPLTLNATDIDAVADAFDSVAAEFGRIDAVAHCVGSMLLKPAHLTSAEQWAEVLETNLTSAFAVVRAAGRTMKQGGSVVLYSTVAARHGLANHEAIAAAKAGVEGLARSAAATYASRHLRFNAIAPSLVRAGMSRRIVDNDSARAASEKMHPLGRIGEPADVSSLAAFLMDPAHDWITGQVFGVDGGLSTVRAATR